MRFRLLKLARCSFYSIALKTLKVQEPNTTIGNQSLWTGDIGLFSDLSQELVTLIVDMLGFADRFLFCKVPYVNEVVAIHAGAKSRPTDSRAHASVHACM